jgi:predicted nicotinamide N-methyase
VIHTCLSHYNSVLICRLGFEYTIATAGDTNARIFADRIPLFLVRWNLFSRGSSGPYGSYIPIFIMPSKQQPLMLPGPTWPVYDFCLSTNGQRFRIAGEPIYLTRNNEDTNTHSTTTTTTTAADHAVRTANTVWDASLTLARHLEQQADTLRGKHILELGAGQAIPSMAAAILGGHVTATDAPNAMENLQRVIQLYTETHPSYPTIHIQALDWQDARSWPTHHTWDYILASDVLWLYPLVAPLVQTLNALTHHTTTIWMTHQTRSERVDQHFRDLISHYGLHIKCIDTPNYSSSPIQLWEIRRQTS